MIGKIDPSFKQVNIIGGGISGLLAGYTLKKKGYQIQIFEASPRVGGLIHTQQTPYGPVESAAHSLLVSKAVQNFFDELNVPLIPLNPKSKARYIVRDGKMHRMPLHFSEIMTTLKKLLSKPKDPFFAETGSLQEWGDAYLGPAATRFLLSPFITGIYSCTPKELNAHLAFPSLVNNDPHLSLWSILRSRKKSNEPRPQMMTPLNGMETLVGALSEKLKAEIRVNAPVTDLHSLSGNIILTLPAYTSSPLLKSIDPASSEALSKVNYSSLITITVFYHRSDFKKHPPRGVGVLIPRKENYRILGCLFNSSAFSNRVVSEDTVSLTVMLGGTTDPEAIHLTHDQIHSLINEELRTLLNTKNAPLHLEITRWKNAIPIYSSDLKFAISQLTTGFCAQPGRVIFSNYSKTVSIRGLIESLPSLAPNQ